MGKLRDWSARVPIQVQTLTKEVVWFFEVKSNDEIRRGRIGGENVAKLLQQSDESKGVKNVRYASACRDPPNPPRGF